MPIYQSKPLSPFEPPDSMAALKALLGGNTGITGGRQQPSLNADDPGGYVQGAANREHRLGEMQRNLSKSAGGFGRFGTGATGQDVVGLEQDIQEDPMTGQAAQQDVAEEEALNQKMQQYGRPDVTEQRQNSENFALKKLLMPLQMKGQYAVQAAGARANVAEESQQRQFANQAQHDERMIQSSANLAQDKMTGGAQLAREKFLQEKRRKEGNTGWFGTTWGATDQSKAEDAELAQLIAGHQGGQAQQGGTIRVVGPNGETGSVPAGTPLPAGWSQQ